MSGNLCGYVVRGSRPVADVTITVLEGPGSHPDLAPITDSDGWFCLDNLRRGRWRLRAHAPDAATADATAQVWDDSLSEVTIHLPNGGTEPVPEPAPEPDGDVDSYGTKYDGSPGWPAHRGKAKQPAEGRPGTPGRTAPGTSTRGRRSPARPGVVIGRVTDTVTGQPVPGALVIVTDGPGPLPDAAVRTDANGVFRITGLPAGDWALHVDHQHAGRADLVVGVVAGRPVNITVALPSGSADPPE